MSYNLNDGNKKRYIKEELKPKQNRKKNRNGKQKLSKVEIARLMRENGYDSFI